MPDPLFFSFDGVDGTGKSTQMDRCSAWLVSRGLDVVTCRDPGTTRLGEQLRQLVLDPAAAKIAPRSEALMYMTARAQLVNEVIRPALDAGKVVLSDRYVLATVVYQGYGLAMDPEALWQVGRFATDGVMPTKTMVLDMDIAAAALRRTGQADRIEQRDADYFQKLRDGFRTESQKHPQAIVMIDASGSEDDVHRAIRDVLEEHLPS